MTQHEHTCPISQSGADEETKITRSEEERSKKPVGLQQSDHPETVHDFLEMTEERLVQINKELREAFETISKFPKSVTFFGSARLHAGTKYYEMTRELAKRCCAEGYGVVTGGGPGIMEAGNRGSHEACGSGIGFNIVLPFEQKANEYVTHGVDFSYFFTRKFVMNFTGEAYVCFPGGFGTMDEFFEILTLVQTKKIEQVPIILVGTEFWEPIVKYSQEVLLEQFGTISPEDMDLIHMTDDQDEIMKLITEAPLREKYYH